MNRVDKLLISNRRYQLNKKNFPSEKWFMNLLVSRGHDGFLRNYPLLNKFYGDFVWRRAKVVVEIDGKHHKKKKQREYDRWRDKMLSSYGYKVYRISAYSKDEAMKVLDILDKYENIRREKKASPRCVDYFDNFKKLKEDILRNQRSRAIKSQRKKQRIRQFREFCKSEEAKNMVDQFLRMKKDRIKSQNEEKN